MANNNQASKVEQTTRIGDLPAQMPNDEAPKDALQERAERQAKQLDESLEATTDKETGQQRVQANGVGINPSSTYPGRNQELMENDMRIPTAVDLAKRAKFAGSQIPAIVHDAGLVDEDGNINVDVEEANFEEADEADETDDNLDENNQ